MGGDFQCFVRAGPWICNNSVSVFQHQFNSLLKKQHLIYISVWTFIGVQTGRHENLCGCFTSHLTTAGFPYSAQQTYPLLKLLHCEL